MMPKVLRLNEHAGRYSQVGKGVGAEYLGWLGRSPVGEHPCRSHHVAASVLAVLVGAEAIQAQTEHEIPHPFGVRNGPHGGHPLRNSSQPPPPFRYASPLVRTPYWIGHLEPLAQSTASCSDRHEPPPHLLDPLTALCTRA